MTLRERLIDKIFGSAGLPTATPTITQGVSDPIGISASSVDRLTSGDNYGYLYHPASPVGKVLICHQGHEDQQVQSLGNRGLKELAQAVVSAGWSVLVLGMPGRCGNGGSSDHTGYTSLEPFLRHVVQAVNYLSPTYDVSMAGISGGGWTTTVAAAIDPRIAVSAPVAGSLPRSLRVGTASVGDWEQQKIYDVCDYPSLYAMASDASGRKQVQVLNRYDPVCFARDGATGAYGVTYSDHVAGVVNSVVAHYGGEFQFCEDASHSLHQISEFAITSAILPALRIPQASQTIDDMTPGCSLVGSIGSPNVSNQIGVWVRWDNGGVNGSYVATDNTGSERLALYEFPVVSGASYTVAIGWLRHTNRSTAVRIRALFGQQELASWSLNQQGATGLAWANIGTVNAASSSLAIEISTAGANGFVVADAVKLSRI